MTLLTILHTAYAIFLLIGPFLSNNLTYLSFLIFMYIMLITSWGVYGECVLTGMENEANPDKYADGKNKNYIAKFLENVTGLHEMIIYYFMYLVPVVNSGVALWKLRRSCR